MDPVTAVGLASAILTFIDFGWEVASGAVGVYRSLDGTLDENARLGDVMDDLHLIAEDLKTGSPGKTPLDRALKKLAENCLDDSKELQDILQKLSVKGKRTAWKSLKASLASQLKSDQIKGLKRRLQESRSEILLHLNRIFR